MRSPADSGAGARLLLERAARVVALGALLWLVVLAFRERPAEGHRVVRSGDLRPALIAWSSSGAPASAHIQAEKTFAPHERDWLRALAASGTAVTWEGGGPDVTALTADPVADPEGGTSAWIAVSRDAEVVLEDAAGRLDSIRSGSGGARILIRSGSSEIVARSGSAVARSAVPDSMILGKLLLLGRAGWESKFVATALEERGWKLDARFKLSPRGDVRQGAPAAIDTTNYSAVLVLDSVGAVEAMRIAAFGRAGGGVILAGSALRVPALAGLAAGSPGPPESGLEPFDTLSADPRRGLELVPIILRPDAVPLERRAGLAAVAARRIERGRAVTVGYVDTWRWRMGGGASAVEAHRDWWADLVAGVAHTRRIARAPSRDNDEAPRATMIARLGPSSAPPPAGEIPFRISEALLFALLAAALLLEWSSRRLRGAP